MVGLLFRLSRLYFYECSFFKNIFSSLCVIHSVNSHVLEFVTILLYEVHTQAAVHSA